MSYKSKFGFTLAEVLITLGIIGVVAALVMPSLIAKYQEKENVVKLKKFYSAISQAYLQVQNDEGGPLKDWGLSSAAGSGSELVLMDKFLKYMNTSKICGNNSGCFPSVYLKFSDGSVYSNWDTAANCARAILADGTLIMFNLSNAGSPIDAQIYVDINGFRGPNVVGKDAFHFYIVGDKIVPAGAPDVFPGMFESSCLAGNGYGCTAWVIYNENMDYLRCKDLDWNTKTKC